MTVAPLVDVRPLAKRLSARVLLGVTVVLLTVVHALLTIRISSPWIVPDEIIYSELAKSIARGELPAIRGEFSVSYGVGYPLLLAPVWALFDDVATAYGVAKAFNAFVLSLTAVPAYLLARRFMTDAHALVVAALSIAVPSMLYAGTLMTEVALYPAFVLSLFCMTAALERPSLAAQVGALSAIGLASSVKMLAAVLVPAYLAAIILFHWLETRRISELRARLSAYAPTWIAFSTLFVAAIGLPLMSGASPLEALGAYAVVLGHIDWAALPWWALLHVAELDLYVAVIPFAATVLAAYRGFGSHATRTEQLFAALLVPTTGAILLTVAAYASPAHAGADGYLPSVARLHERATFVLAPLFFIGLMVFLRGGPGRTRAIAAACVIAATLPGVIPADQLVSNSIFQALALVPWAQLDPWWPAGMLAFTSVLGLIAFLGATSRVRPAGLVIVIATVFAMVSAAVQSSMVWASNWASQSGRGPVPNWIDRAADSATVSVLWWENSGGSFVVPARRHRIAWLGEFFNHSVGTVYELGTPMPYDLPATHVRLQNGVVVLADGRPAPLDELILVPCHVRVDGVPIARDPATGAAVVRVNRPVRASILEPGSCPVGGAP